MTAAEVPAEGRAVPRVLVEVWSDVVCPWCWIGKRRFEQAVALLDGIVDVEVRFRPFLLDPRATDEPRPVRDVYARKFGGEDAADQALAHFAGLAEAEGLHYDWSAGQVRVTTMPAHRLLWLAEQEGDQQAVADALFAAYFTEGRNLALPETLVEAGAAGGLPEARVRAMLASAEGVAEVQAQLDRAEDRGITAVPTFLVADTWPIPGAQDVATFERVLRRLAEALADEEPDQPKMP